jgi:hypothetical protein
MAKTDQIAVIQYLDQTKAREILEQPICVNVCGASSASTKLAVSLWYTTDASLPDIKSGSSLSLVASLDANGIPASENGTWVQISRGTLGNGYATLAPLTSAGYTSVPLSGWDLASHTTAATATYFAIVIGTPSVASGATISLESVSLQSGTIATRPAPQTADEVLRECQYYYQKSFETNTVPAVNAGANTGETYFVQSTVAGSLGYIPVRFSSAMRVTPVNPPLFYSPYDGSTLIRNVSTGNNYTTTTLSVNTLSTRGFVIQGNSEIGSGAGNLLAIHWTVDSRLGVI